MTVSELRPHEAIQSINRKMKDQIKIDWEQRRYEIAKDIMAGMYSKTTEGRYSNSREIALISVRAADALIEELKR